MVVLTERLLRFRQGSGADPGQVREVVIEHSATPELDVDRIVASSAGIGDVFDPQHEQAAMIELRCTGVADELVAVCLEVDGVAVGPRVVRTQAAEDEGPSSVVVKPVTGRKEIHRRFDCPVG